MNFLPNPKSRNKDSAVPRLIPFDHYPVDPIPGLPHPDPADSDLTFEDALADIQFSRFLHSEYDVQAPAESFTRVMSAIQAGEQSKPASKPARLSPLRGLAFLGTALASTLSRPVAARVASGVIAVALMAAALVPNVSMILKDSTASNLTSPSAASSQVNGRNMDDVVPHQKSVLSHTQPQVYDRAALLSNDPPDTLAPPIRDVGYMGEPQVPERDAPTMLLRKE
jgi:hypothetical protein